MTEDEALKAFFVEWSRQASEYGGYLTCEQRDCAEEAWNAALAWLRSQGAPVATLYGDNDVPKSCPFCGGAAEFDHDDNGWNWIECLACGASTNARTSAMDDCKPLLLEQWNKRASLAPQPAIPDGWQLVPKEHTKEVAHAMEMLVADGYASYQEAWTDMLAAAAPEPSK